MCVVFSLASARPRPFIYLSNSSFNWAQFLDPLVNFASLPGMARLEGGWAVWPSGPGLHFNPRSLWREACTCSNLAGVETVTKAGILTPYQQAPAFRVAQTSGS